MRRAKVLIGVGIVRPHFAQRASPRSSTGPMGRSQEHGLAKRALAPGLAAAKEDFEAEGFKVREIPWGAIAVRAHELQEDDEGE